MPIKYVKGNLLRSNCDIIAHGCNCFCNMEAGIAKQIATEYPEAAEADFFSYRGNIEKMGTGSWANSNEKRIYNLYTQYKYGNEEVHVEYDSVQKSLEFMRVNLISNNLWDKKIGIPLIGCGLAGGDWNIVSQIVEEVFHDKQIFVYVLDMKEVKTAKEQRSKIKKAIKDMTDVEYFRKKMFDALKVPRKYLTKNPLKDEDYVIKVKKDD